MLGHVDGLVNREIPGQVFIRPDIGVGAWSKVREEPPSWNNVGVRSHPVAVQEVLALVADIRRLKQRCKRQPLRNGKAVARGQRTLIICGTDCASSERQRHAASSCLDLRERHAIQCWSLDINRLIETLGELSIVKTELPPATAQDGFPCSEHVIRQAETRLIEQGARRQPPCFQAFPCRPPGPCEGGDACAMP